MADELKIRLTIAGQKELNDLIAKGNELGFTISELKTIQKAFAAERTKNIIGSAEEIRLAKEEVKVKEAIAAASEKVLTKKAHERDEYFKTGLQLRQGLLPMMGDLQSFLQGGAFNAQSFSTSITNISSSFTQMTAKGFSAKEILSGIGKSLMGPAGVAFALTAVGGLVASFISSLDKSKDKIEEQRRANEGWKKSLEVLPIEAVESRLKTFQERIASINSYNNSIGAGIGGRGAIAVWLFGIDDKKVKEGFQETQDLLDKLEMSFIKTTDDRIRQSDRARKLEEVKNLETESARLRGKLRLEEEFAIEDVRRLQGNEKRKEETILAIKAEYGAKRISLEMEIADAEAAVRAERAALAEQSAGQRALQGPPKGASPSPFNLGLGKGKRPGLSKGQEDDEKADEFGLKKSEKEFDKLSGVAIRALSPIQQGFNALGNMLEDKLVGNLRRSTSEFSQFVGGVLSGVPQIATQLASSALVSLLGSLIFPTLGFGGIFSKMTGFASGGIIPEPVLGRGLQSGRMYSFGERGPERVGPNVNQIGQASRFGGGGGRDGNVFVVENRITDTGLSTFVRRGDRKLTKRSY